MKRSNESFLSELGLIGRMFETRIMSWSMNRLKCFEKNYLNKHFMDGSQGRRGGSLVVSVQALNSDNLSLNPTAVLSFFL